MNRIPSIGKISTTMTTCTTESARGAPALASLHSNIYIAQPPLIYIMEPDLQEKLHRLQESLRRIKALLAWERLKRCESGFGGTSLFQMHDPTQEDLRNEYDFFVTILLEMHSILKNHSTIISQTGRDDVWPQLADVERQVYWLGLHRRFAGPGG